MSHDMPSSDPEKPAKATLSKKAGFYVLRKCLEVTSNAVYGKGTLPGFLMGLSEDSILHPRLCHPDMDESYLTYRQSHAGQWLAYDFRRTEFYPQMAKIKGFTREDEGILGAFVPEDIKDKPQDERTDIPLPEWFSADMILAFDKPGIEHLLELGMVARRSFEKAYEIAEREMWIDELRSKGLANDQVYQVTPKGHTLLLLQPDAGKKTPKRDTKPEFVRAPGILAH